MVCKIPTRSAEKVDNENILGNNIEKEKSANNKNMTDHRNPMKLQHLAGGNLITHPPLFAANGDCLFLLKNKTINVYSTSTGEHVGCLSGATDKLISMQLELQQEHILVACSESGEVLRWHWESGKLTSKQNLKLTDAQVITFNLLNLYHNSESALAFVTVRYKGAPVKWVVYDTTTGYAVNVPMEMRLTYKNTMVDVDSTNFKFLVIAQEYYLYFVDYAKWTWRRMKNPLEVPVTVVRCHPKEAAVATGDELGKIFIWRNFMCNTTVDTSLYHWHHTAVTSLAFSGSGTSFFSSGHEAVLVRWNLEHRDLRNFLPRLSANVTHIAVNKNNTEIAIATVDNGITLIGNDFKLKNTLQELTFIEETKTGQTIFPAGLSLNPRNNTLALNGRIGHLQFYSPYTRKLLYNMDVVMQNKLSEETGRILYDIIVEKAAFNIDWIATGEVFNDLEHLPESRLKFWQYDETTQSYKLNTNIELPHEGAFKAIEFSTQNHNDNLLCATVGEDNHIKIWALENSDNIYRLGSKVWTCVAQTRYKDYTVEAISFSQDGGLLAAGYGNILCIYKATNLRLKAALNAGPSIAGNALKLVVTVPASSDTDKPKHSQNIDDISQVMQLFKNILQGNNMDKLCQQFKQVLRVTNMQPLNKLANSQKVICGKKLRDLPNISLSHKLAMFQAMNISCEVPAVAQTHMSEFINTKLTTTAKRHLVVKLQRNLPRIKLDQRFKAKYRYKLYRQRKSNYEQRLSSSLSSLAELLNLKIEEATTSSKKSKKLQTDSVEACDTPMLLPTQIRHVQFASNDKAHLVLACTETRVFVWNLLTLRLNSISKLSVQKLAFNADTNMFAAITKKNELFIFTTSFDKVIYYQANMPNVSDLIWMPRRHTERESSEYAWEMNSTLFFLTAEQEIVYLTSKESDALSNALVAPIAFTNTDMHMASLRYSTFGKFISKQFTQKQNEVKRQIGNIVLGNKSQVPVEMLINMTTHTMPPLHALCLDFLKAMTKSESEAERSVETQNSKNLLNGSAALEEDVNVEENDSTIERRRQLEKVEKSASLAAKTNISNEKRLEQISELDFDIVL